MIEEGKPAPDFELKSDSGETIKLSELRGKPVVLYFYPKDDKELPLMLRRGVCVDEAAEKVAQVTASCPNAPLREQAVAVFFALSPIQPLSRKSPAPGSAVVATSAFRRLSAQR